MPDHQEIQSNEAREKEFKTVVAKIKQFYRNRREQNAFPRPKELINLALDIDNGCYHWVGPDTERKYWSVMPLTDTEYFRYRFLDAEYWMREAYEICIEKNATIVEIENLLYNTLDHVPQYQNFGRKLRDIQTILDNDPIS